MPDEITTDHTQSGTVQRDSEGELIPEEHDVDLPNGDTVVIKTKPITTGLLNELSNIDDAIADLEPSAIYEAFQTIYLSDALLGMSKQDIRDTRAEYLTSYLEPLNEAVEDEIGDESGNPAQMSRSERAQKMR